VSTTAVRAYRSASGPSGVAAPDPGPSLEIIDLLGEVRARTLLLLEPLTDGDAAVQHDPLMSPVVWDLGHIAAFEELWLLRHLERPFEGLASLGEMPGVFNPFEHPRRTRGGLALPARDEALAILADVRREVLARLPSVDCSAAAPPLTRNGYVYRMVAQHEAQHGETMLQTLQLKQGEPYHPSWRTVVPRGRKIDGGMVRFPGGRIRVGTDDRAAAYDNERPCHEVSLAAF
jgi:gamma-glutamyl hercynylcysteine S-oxide synthase